MFQIEGKVALVTGAGSGIGLAYVHELLRNNAKGVALVDIDINKANIAVTQIENKYGKDRAIAIKADVCSREQVKDAFEATIKKFNQLDIVVNNAGIIQELQWEKCVNVNLIGVLTGTILAMETYLPKYKSSPEAIVINAGSLTGLIPFGEGPIYGAVKAGVIHFTRSMGTNIRYEKHQVRVIAVCPGYTNTDLLDVLTESQCDEPYLSRFKDMYKNGLKQTTEDVAKNLSDLIKEAPNGSIWTVICGKKKQINFPNLF